MKLNRTLRDCVYGMAVGDALGVPFEFKPRGSFECVDMVGGGSIQPTRWYVERRHEHGACAVRQLSRVGARRLR